MKVENELYRLAEMYKESTSDDARYIYNNFAYLMILDEPLGEQSDLEKLWESIKE